MQVLRVDAIINDKRAEDRLLWKWGIDMTDREISYVSTIARCGSITQAAEQLFIAQPSLTQALHRIEAEYGTVFFHRGQGGLRLTEAGQAYLNASERMKQSYQRMECEISEAAGTRRGRVTLGITPFQGRLLLPGLLTLYHQRFPMMDLRLLENSSAQLEQLAWEGRLDLAILHRPFRDYNLEYISLCREEFCLAVPPNDPDYLAASAKGDSLPLVTAEILSRKSFNMLTPNQRSRQVADNICAAAGIVPKILYSTTSFATSLALTADGIGAAFAPRSFARHYEKQYQTAHFRFPPNWNAGWELVAAYAPNLPLSQPCLELARIIQECVASMPEVCS